MDRLKQLRKIRRMTQVEVCRAIGCPRPLYALIEQGALPPREQDLKALASLYKVSVQYLQ